MAEETFLSIEKTLVELIRFVKRILITLLDCLFRAKKIIYSVKKSSEAVQPLQQPYLHYFAYLLICTMIMIPVYKVNLFNTYNDIEQSAWEMVKSAFAYLFSTSIYEQLAICFFFVTINFLIVRALGCWLAGSVEKPLRKRIRFIWDRMVYYFQGTLFIIWVILFFLKDSPVKNIIKEITWLFISAYIIYCCFTFFKFIQKASPRNYTRKQTAWLIQVGLISLVMVFGWQHAARVLIIKALDYSGYRNYDPRVIIMNPNGGKTLELYYQKDTARRSSLSASFLIQNKEPFSILLDHARLQLYIHPVSMQDIADTLEMRVGKHAEQDYYLKPGDLRRVEFYADTVSAALLARIKSLQQSNSSSISLESRFYYTPQEKIVGRRKIDLVFY